jgi:hypothetical protein
MVIWRDIGVRIYHKTPHIRFIGDRLRNAFTNDLGDIPIVNFNEITGRIEPVVNLRGSAYAARRRFAYRRNKFK